MKTKTPQKSSAEASSLGCPKPILAIINAKTPVKVRREITKRLNDLGVQVSLTTYSGHAIELARQATSFRTLIAVGGDGTVSEIATGMDLTTHNLAIIPAGTHNYIARALGIRTVDAAIQTLKSGSISAVDVVEAATLDSSHKRTARRFVGFLACGHEAEIARRARARKKGPPLVRDTLAAATAASSVRSVTAKLTVDADKESEVTVSSLLVNNCGADAFTSTPSWDLCDGAVETLVAHRGPVPQFFSSLRRLVKTRPSKNWREGVGKLTCRFDKPVGMVADGELLVNVTTLALAVAARKLKIVVPGDVKLKKR